MKELIEKLLLKYGPIHTRVIDAKDLGINILDTAGRIKYADHLYKVFHADLADRFGERYEKLGSSAIFEVLTDLLEINHYNLT